MEAAVSTIIEAITGGAAAGASIAASNSVQTSYNGLINLIRRRLSKNAEGYRELKRVIDQPESDTGELQRHLRSCEANEDSEIIEAATTFLRLMREDLQSRYRIDAYRVQGVVQGDNNDVRMEF